MILGGCVGTGKTQTIIAMISGLLSSVSSPSPMASVSADERLSTRRARRRVLLCAASNAAVDELLKRLLVEIRDGEGHLTRVNIIRLGRVADDADVSVKNSTLDAQTEAIVKIELPWMDLAKVNANIVELRLQLDKASGGENIQHIKYQLSMARLSKTRLESILDKLRAEVSQCLLRDADVVVSTLSSAGQQQLIEHLVTSRIVYDVAIVDEAAQTTEPSVLIPLRYGCTQLILVGDPRQLPPTVLSDAAAKAGLSMSLFERLEKVCIHVCRTRLYLSMAFDMFIS
jgi:senataxin